MKIKNMAMQETLRKATLFEERLLGVISRDSQKFVTRIIVADSTERLEELYETALVGFVVPDLLNNCAEKRNPGTVITITADKVEEEPTIELFKMTVRDNIRYDDVEIEEILRGLNEPEGCEVGDEWRTDVRMFTPEAIEWEEAVEADKPERNKDREGGKRCGGIGIGLLRKMLKRFDPGHGRLCFDNYDNTIMAVVTVNWDKLCASLE